MPTIILGADHAGFRLKEELKRSLETQRIEIEDVSPVFSGGDDYPTIAQQVAKRVGRDPHVLAILACGTGYGMDIAANRIKGARAAVVRNTKDARLTRLENHTNILILGGWTTKPVIAKRIMNVWLKTKPSHAERHLRRIKMLDRL